MQKDLNDAFSLVSQGSNQHIQEGEKLLQRLRRQSEYPIALLQYMAQSPADRQLRAAIQLRLWCQLYHQMQIYERNDFAVTIFQLKAALLQGYFQFPCKVSKTLRAAILSIAAVQFPDAWPQLLPTILNAQQSTNSTFVAFKLLTALTERYGQEERSDPLYHQIIIVCNAVHDLALELTATALSTVQAGAAIEVVQVLRVLMRLFYNLNYQDLHPKFQDNLNNWMGILKRVMNLPNSSEEAFRCKGAALEAIILYANKYRDDVQDTIKGFCQEIWQLCSSATDDPQYDPVVFNCLRFFRSLVQWNDMKAFFQTHLDNLMVHLILPHIAITQRTLQLLQEQTPLFIEYYFKRIQFQTRRAAALELLRVLARNYDVLPNFIQGQLQNFQQLSNPDQVAQATLLNLVIDASCKGFRESDGCFSLFIPQTFVLFTYTQVLSPILQKLCKCSASMPLQHAFSPLLITSILRFLYYFRTMVPQNELPSVLQLLCNVSLQTPALRSLQHITLYALVTVRHGNFSEYTNLMAYFDAIRLKDHAAGILNVVQTGDMANAALDENLTKLLHAVVRNLAQSNGVHAKQSLAILTQMLKKTKQFDFATVAHLFQAIGYLTYYLLHTNHPSQHQLQTIMMNFFSMQISNQSDLLNFCFQIFCLFVRVGGRVGSHYLTIYESILNESNWVSENTSLLSAYLQYVVSFMDKITERLTRDRTAYEVIFSKLISLELYELFFRFVETVARSVGLDAFASSGYLALTIQGASLIANSSTQARSFTLVFFCRLAVSHGVPATLHYINAEGFFASLVLQSTDIIQTVQTRKDRKEVIACLSEAIVCGCFSRPEIEGQLLNLMLQNLSSRFNFNKLTEHFKQNEKREKKQSTYKKLLVFNELDPEPQSNTINEEGAVVSAYCALMQQSSPALQFLTKKNVDSVNKMAERMNKVLLH